MYMYCVDVRGQICLCVLHVKYIHVRILAVGLMCAIHGCRQDMRTAVIVHVHVLQIINIYTSYKYFIHLGKFAVPYTCSKRMVLSWSYMYSVFVSPD